MTQAINRMAVKRMETDFKPLFDGLFALQVQIKEKLANYADGKALKGYELVGWLGEIYVKLLFDGKLVDDRNEHDVQTRAGWRISVKARKGTGAGWRQTSPIPKFEGEGCPTHLAFVHLHDDYTLDRVWLFDWCHLCDTMRFTSKNVTTCLMFFCGANRLRFPARRSVLRLGNERCYSMPDKA